MEIPKNSVQEKLPITCNKTIRQQLYNNFNITKKINN